MNIQGRDGDTAWVKTSKRVTIRISGALREILEQRSRSTGQDLSTIVRAALELTIVCQTRPEQAVEKFVPTRPETRPVYIFPRELEQLLPRYRSFGMEAMRERRRGFGALLAVCEVVREHTKNIQDRVLCAELLQIGRRFGLLR
jgi:hypothetical protein